VALRLLTIDLEADPLPAGPFELIVSIDFLHRPLFVVFPGALAPGGVLVFAQATRTNLTRHPRPSARFLLEDGELRRLVRGLEVLRYDEGWFDDRHEARLVARRRDP
jgi:tellurite methyltransferase